MEHAMGLSEPLRDKLRTLYRPVVEMSPALKLLLLFGQGRVERSTGFVEDGYGKTWSNYRGFLERAKTLDEWITVKDFDTRPHAHQIDGKVKWTRFDSNEALMRYVFDALETHFPNVQSITEYGCGAGRNLLRLKQRLPHLKCYGYELADAGVEVGRAAAAKFDVDVEYAQLDYVNDGAEKYVHPQTDVAFTMFSLEQIPVASIIAVKNMHQRVKLGSIHVEPVCENYPWTYRGILGRLYTRQVDMLRNFDKVANCVGAREVHKRVFDTSPNPLMFPSRYVLLK